MISTSFLVSMCFGSSKGLDAGGWICIGMEGLGGSAGFFKDSEEAASSVDETVFVLLSVADVCLRSEEK